MSLYVVNTTPWEPMFWAHTLEVIYLLHECGQWYILCPLCFFHPPHLQLLDQNQSVWSSRLCSMGQFALCCGLFQEGLWVAVVKVTGKKTKSNLQVVCGSAWKIKSLSPMTWLGQLGQLSQLSRLSQLDRWRLRHPSSWNQLRHASQDNQMQTP